MPPQAANAVSSRRNLHRMLEPGASFGIGPFSVAPALGMTPIDPASPVVFDIAWRGRPVAARLEQGDLHVSAILGRVPSTAAGGAPLHAGVFEFLGQLPAELPPPWTLSLLPDHRVQVAWSQPLPAPMSVAALVCRLTEFLLALAPYLDLMEESGVSLLPPSAAADGGTSSF